MAIAAKEQQVVLINNYIETVWNKKDLTHLEDYFNKNAKFYSQLAEVSGSENIKNFIKKFQDCFSDMQVEILDTVAQDNKVVIHLELTGTCKDNFLGIPAQSQKINYEGMILFYLENNKIQECYVQADHYGLLTQLGAIPKVLKVK